MMTPKIISALGHNANCAQFTIEPFGRGLAKTVGIALRRTLLSAVAGTAPTLVDIEGIQHRYSSISGILEDVPSILTNIKKLAVRCAQTTATLKLHQSGSKTVCAKDIELPECCQIMNPELIVCHLVGGRLKASIKVERGWGYTLGRFEQVQHSSSIPLEVSFSPVRNVNYSTSSIKVSTNSNAEKLIISIETNATITPADALFQSINVLKSQFSMMGGNEV